MSSQPFALTSTLVPPMCEKHSRLMTLAMWARPEGVPGNGWVCEVCREEAKPVVTVTPGLSFTFPTETTLAEELPVHPHEKRFFEILKEDGDLHRKKSADYGNDEDPFANVLGSSDWGIEPWLGIIIRVEDKMRRLKSLVRNGKLVNESAVDSLRDIRCYTAMAQVLFEEFMMQRGGETSEDRDA